MKTARSRKSLASFALLVTALTAGVMALSACSGGGGSSGGKSVAVLFSPQANQLDIYDLKTDAKTTLIPSAEKNVNGQACLVPGGKGKFLMGEDTGQKDGARQGWMIFTPDGQPVQKLDEPRADNEPKQPEPFGCAFDSEKRLFASDIGGTDFDGKNGKLIVFFPPDYTTSCILSHNLRVAGTVAVEDDGSVLVAESVPPSDILRFSKPYPKDASECDSVPATQSVFITDEHLGTAAGIVRAPNGNWYISSVFVGAGIYEFDKQGNYVRTIISGDNIGNPQGIAVGPDGTIYYADLAIAVTTAADGTQSIGPVDGKGTVRKVTFDAGGKAQTPVIIGSGFDYPDAVSVLEQPKDSRPAATP